MRVIVENEGGIRMLCKACNEQFVVRKDERGVPEKRKAAELFKRDLLQGNENLFYKYHPEFLLK